MATPEPWYYDTSTGAGYPTSTTDTTTAGGNYFLPTRVPVWDSTPTQYRTVTRKILVKSPDNWTKEQTLKFSKLVNKETETGWKVTLIISGEIIITDPNVERRTMEEFIPLLKDTATKRDIGKIDEFFVLNSIKK